jgi:EAL domain-containing protein (putative c-di-GMP-specific phosphodiesterase class I)
MHRLRDVEASTSKATIDQGHALSQMTEQLLGMQGKGFSVPELAQILSRSGFGISDDELQEFLSRASAGTRRDWYNEMAQDPGRRGHLGSFQRAMFIERQLAHAATTGEGLQLHYQPQVDMTSGAVVGAEALLRLRHGDEFIGPAEFIPIAEATGLISAIGDWVIREACAEAVRWKRAGLGDGDGIKVAVNLSVKQFSEDLPSRVQAVISESGLDPSLLGLEITESFLAGDVSMSLLQRLRATGLQLSMDDFGTGYSCLSRVTALPLNTIKLDRSFVIDLGRTDGAAAVVEAVVGLAAKLGMTTIAEGVETSQQAEILMALGCTVAQGYLFSRPVPSAEFVAFARRESADVRDAEHA